MTDVNIKVSWDGGPFPLGDMTSSIGGISVSYAINYIPLAKLTVSAYELALKAPKLLCDPDKYKNRNSTIKIEIKTKTGCLNFDGYFDGLSISQTPGSFDYSIIVKNSFQPLFEIFPKLLGTMPGSTSLLRPITPFTFKGTGPSFEQAYTTMLKQKVSSVGKHIFQCLWSMISALLQEQNAVESLVNSTGVATPELLGLLSSKTYKKSLNIAEEIFNNRFILTPVAGCILLSSHFVAKLAELISSNNSSLWEVIIDICNDMGCAVVIGNNYAWVVPHANYLKFPIAEPGFQALSTGLINTAYPADYNNFTVSDTSYKSIRACYVSNESPVHAANIGDYNTSFNWGVYPKSADPTNPDIPDDGGTGILIVTADTYIGHLVNQKFINLELIKRQAAPAESPCGETAPEPPKAAAAAAKKTEEDNKLIKEYSDNVMNSYAKSKFLQKKYEDRVGSFSMPFNPNWVPGSSGGLYSRLPGMCFNFYVTNVMHNIVIQTPNVGAAITQVSFASCRFNTSPKKVPGVDSDPLYEYDVNKMKEFQKAWVSDVTGK